MNLTHLRRRPMALVASTSFMAVLAALGFWSLGQRAEAQDKPASSASAPSGKPGDRPTPPVAVTVATVRAQDIPIYRTGIGTVAPMQTVIVKARVDGQLDKVGFTEGQDVKAGQVIARLDPRTLQAQLAQVQATKAKDMATLTNARADLARYSSLFSQDAATQQQVDTQKALVNQLEAAIKADDAQIAYAQVQLSFTTITAPISGRVGARLVDPGNIVKATDTNGIVVINQIDPVAVVFTMPEEAFQDINRALNASGAKREQLRVEAYPRNGNELLGAGKLILLNNQIDTATGTVSMKGSFANPTHTLWPGQYVNVRLVLGQRSGALTIPAPAVQRGPNGTYVYLVGEDRTVQTQPITVSQIQEGMATIDKGLSAGQKVVVDGQYKLRPGATITEQQARRPGAPASSPGGSNGPGAPASGSSAGAGATSPGSDAKSAAAGA